MISVLLIDDNAFIRACLCRLLEHEPDIEVVGEISCVSDGLVNTQTQCSPDVIVIDCIQIGACGLWCVRKMMQKNAQVKFLIIIMHESIHFAERALKLGVKGILDKTAEPQMLIDSIRTIAAGGMFLQGGLAQQLAIRRASGKSGLDSLSAREFEVFCLLARGFRCRDISEFLHISAKTAGVHRTNIMNKLELKNIAGLILMALEYGLLSASGNAAIPGCNVINFMG